MSGAAGPTDASSQDVYAIPEAMRRHVIPRRGGAEAEAVAVDPDAAAHLAAWLAGHSSDVAAILGRGDSDADLVEQFKLTLATSPPPPRSRRRSSRPW